MTEPKITKKDIEHLKKLARVEFGERDTETLAGDLEKILVYIETLKEVDVSGVQEMTHAADLKNVFLKDENPREFDEALVSKLVSVFPTKQQGYLKVKSVFKK